MDPIFGAHFAVLLAERHVDDGIVVADFLVYKMNYNLGDGYPIHSLDTDAVQMTGVTRESLDYIVQSVNTQMAETIEIFTK